MRLTINIEKRYAYVILAVLMILIGIMAVKAYNTWSPPQFGHTPGEISPGTFGQESVEPKGVIAYTFLNPVQIQNGKELILGYGTGASDNYFKIFANNHKGANRLRIFDKDNNELLTVASSGNIDMKAGSILNAPNIVSAKVDSTQLCINGNCKSIWPTASAVGSDHTKIDTAKTSPPLTAGKNCYWTADQGRNICANGFYQAGHDTTSGGDSMKILCCKFYP